MTKNELKKVFDEHIKSLPYGLSKDFGIMNLIKRILCNHDYVFFRNIHGDEINLTGGRSWWKCSKCGKLKVKDEYVLPPKEKNMKEPIPPEYYLNGPDEFVNPNESTTSTPFN